MRCTGQYQQRRDGGLGKEFALVGVFLNWVYELAIDEKTRVNSDFPLEKGRIELVCVR